MSTINLLETRTLNLPLSISSSNNSVEVPTTSSVVVVGANGSGKTRLGSWIEFHSSSESLVHRISAQKSLSIPSHCPTSSVDTAENNLFYGNSNDRVPFSSIVLNKSSTRWGSKPNTFLLDDYDKLLTYLFTEEFEESTKFRQQCQTGEQPKPPETHLDIIKRIWESVLPHRELITCAGKIEARSKNGGNSYHGSEMSDGERVIFYLIGQCLAVKKNGIIVIDEPELHLHKALQSRLWNAVEAERPDCIFVYLTHDLDFAVSRINSIKIWLKSYDNNQWDWHLIPESDGIPESLFLEIIGSRKPILFVEGDKASLDFFIFSHLFKDYTIVPNGGSHEVIYATCSFSKLKSLHGLECKGIIDLDFRSDEQIKSLKDNGIFCLNFSEIENLLLSEKVLEAVGISLFPENIHEIIEQTKNLVLTQMDKEKERLISCIVASRIEDKFKNFNAKAIGESELDNSLKQMLTKIDVSSLYQTTSELINNTLDNRDYPTALRLYNNKGLLPQVSGIFGMKYESFINYIKQLIRTKNNKLMTEVLRGSLPEFLDIN